MPLIKPAHNVIEVEVSDRIFDNTIIKQKVEFSLLEHRQGSSNGECSARIAVTVKAYSNDNGAYGIPLHDKGILERNEYLVADNDSVVDARTGELLAVKTTENDTDWLAKVNAYEQPVMLQGDFFEILRDHVEIGIGDMIRQHITQADKMGKFA